MALCPQKIAKKVPVIKNGPKGISDFRPFFFAAINPMPIIAPREKAENKAKRMFGQLKINPINIASLKSPIPIQRPPENKIIANKTNAGKILSHKFDQPLNGNCGKISNNLYKNVMIIPG